MKGCMAMSGGRDAAYMVFIRHIWDARDGGYISDGDFFFLKVIEVDWSGDVTGW